jgi:hypothetical protein
MPPSKNTIIECLGDNLLKEYAPKDADTTACEIRFAIIAATTPRMVDDALDRINGLIHGYGVEAIRNPNDGWKRYYGDISLLYVNMGDTYAPTVIYDVKNQSWHITSWGDFIESKPRRFREARA